MISARLDRHASRIAIVDPNGRWPYSVLVDDANRLAAALETGHADLDDARVALLCDPGHDFVVALLACWHAGAVAVPLHPSHPDAELAYLLADSESTVVVYSSAHEQLARRLAGPIGAAVVAVETGRLAPAHHPPNVVDPTRRAMMLYTSGTTGRPKGVVHTHGGLQAQVESLIEAWAWSAHDRILLVLPLHHVHGVVNVTLCALWAGAECEAPGGFDARGTWDRLASGNLTLFMAVPTIYTRLIAAWDAADTTERQRWSAGAARARLMVSGSAALPVSTLERWQTITGHVLLERYGMTEIGIALSNTLDRRVPGKVGEPLPNVAVRVVDDLGHDVCDGESGELLVGGPQLFLEYWRRADETAAAFVDGWFRTGDVAVHEPDGYRLLGRSSIDIIKTGGEKVSALEIEEVYRTHPSVADCAVVGVPDPEWGERVCAAVVADAATLSGDVLRAWGKERMAAAKVPSRFVFVAGLPRNTMGKVTKAEVSKLFI
ncbi:MAG: acyl-CoA synthetase [Acidimicrobiia bacterium]